MPLIEPLMSKVGLAHRFIQQKAFRQSRCVWAILSQYRIMFAACLVWDAMSFPSLYPWPGCAQVLGLGLGWGVMKKKICPKSACVTTYPGGHSRRNRVKGKMQILWPEKINSPNSERMDGVDRCSKINYVFIKLGSNVEEVRSGRVCTTSNEKITIGWEWNTS